MSREMVNDQEKLIKKELRVVNKLISTIREEQERLKGIFKDMLSNKIIKLSGNNTICAWRE